MAVNREEARRELARRELARRQETKQPSGEQEADDRSFVEKMGDQFMSTWNDLPRAASVAGRNVIEGLGNTVDFVGTPLRAGMVAVGLDDPAGGGQRLADALGLEQPATPTERVLSEIEKVVAGGGGLLGLAGRGQKVSQAGSTLQNVLKGMTARPDLQLASMTGAGGSGGIVKESGGGPGAQLTAALLGGLLVPAAYGTGRGAYQKGVSLMDALRKTPQVNVRIDQTIDSAAKSMGVNPESITKGIREQLYNDMRAAYQQGDDLPPDVIRRLVEYRLVGATPTAGPVTMDPGVITRQKNLMKMGASSTDPKLQGLSQTARSNVDRFTDQLNRMGADTADDALAAGSKVVGSLDDVAVRAKAPIDQLYKQARDTAGRSARLNPSAFTQRANDMLDDALVGGKLPADVRNTLNKIAKGEMPFTVDVAEQLKTRMGQLSRTTADGQERMALGMVRQALEETPLLDDIGSTALKAFNTARAANRQWMQKVEQTPALKAVMDGVEPDKFVQTYITGTGKNASARAVKNLMGILDDDPAGKGAIKSYVARYLKEKATSGKPDEMGSWSSSSYNKALDSIGDAKLKMIFDPKEFNMLKAIGRVSRYEQAQPVGSAVNNSNSGTTMMSGMLDWVGNNQLLRRIPLGGVVADQAKGTSMSIQAGQLSNIPKLVQPPKQPRAAVGVWPLAAPALMGSDKKGNDNSR